VDGVALNGIADPLELLEDELNKASEELMGVKSGALASGDRGLGRSTTEGGGLNGLRGDEGR
jgi:hypothetical protein